MKTHKPSKTAFDDHRKAAADRHYATILTVDPVRHTATVLTSDNRVLRDIPIMQNVGGDGGGVFSTPEPGWHCVTTQVIGVEAVDFCFPAASYFTDGLPPELDENTQAVNTFLSLTSAPVPYRKVENATKNFRSRRPYDLLAGDQGFKSSEGAAVFALRGGVAGMKVDDLCQILLNQVDHLTRIVSRNMEIMADAGLLQAENVKGRTTMRVRANSKAGNTYDGVHEFELGLGTNDSTAFVDWELRTPDAKERVASYKLNQAGTRVTYLRGDDMHEVNGLQGTAITKSQKLLVGADQSTEVDGKQELVVGGKQTISIGSDQTEVIGGKQDVTVSGRHRLKCGDVNLGDTGGQRAPMGETLVAYLQELKFYIDTQLMVMTSVGPSTPGSSMFPSPRVPDLLSNVVRYIK